MSPTQRKLIVTFSIHSLLAVILLIIIQLSDFDVWVSNQFFIPESNQFLLQKYANVGTHFHDLSKIFFIFIGMIFWCISLTHFFKKEWFIKKSTLKKINFISIMSILIPIIILVIRDTSLSHCPRDLTIFGGYYEYFKLLNIGASGLTPGHCNPSSHAASFVWLLAVPWVFTSGVIRLRYYLLTLLFAILMSSIQISRGAHFLSHILWSAWIASLIITLCYDIYFRE